MQDTIACSTIANVNSLDFSNELKMFAFAMDHNNIQLVDYRDTSN